MALTTQQQQDILKYTVGLFGASAGGYFAELGSFVAAGNSAETMARALAGSNAFKNQGFAFSDGSTNEQFATAYLNLLLGSSVSAGVMALANTWFLNQIATVGRPQAVVNAINAIAATATDDPDLGAARLQLDNRTAVASYYTIDLSGTSTDLSALQSTVANVTSTTDVSTPAALQTVIDNSSAAATGETFAGTTGVDTLLGTNFNDVFNFTDTTYTSLDSVDGKAGLDTFNLNDVAGAFDSTSESVTVTSVETANFRGKDALTLDTSSWTGLTALNLLQSNGALDVTAADTTAVTISNTGATGGTIDVVGGSTQTLTVAKAGGAVTLSEAASAVTLTVANQNGQAITIDNGTDVTVTTTDTATSTIDIGGTDAPTGAVTVVQNIKGTGNVTSGAITIDGGSTVNVTVNATQATNNTDTTVGTITVTGGEDTTAVSVTQTAAVSKVATAAAIAAVTEVNTVTFGVMAAGETVILGGLTFTAGAAGTTAEETAAAFANIKAGSTQGNSTLGTYQGVFAGWTAGAVTGTNDDEVVFTSTAAGDVGDLADTGTAGTSTIVETTKGVAVQAAAGKGGIVNGAVDIADLNYGTGTNTITTVVLDAYSTSTVKSDALTTLTLANSTGIGVSVFNNTATTLGLTVNNLGAGSTLTVDAGAATYTALNVATTGANSTLNVTGAAVKALDVSGSKTLNLTGSTFTALETVKISGSAGITLVASGATVKSVDAAGTSGANTMTIDATKATYVGGSGVDTLTTSAAAPSKSINLGLGNDVLVLASGTTSATGAITGGDGTDTLTMVAADAVTASGSDAFALKVTSFETLALTGGTGAQAVDLAVLGNYTTVTTGAEANGGVLTLNKMASGGTLILTSSAVGTGAYTVAVTDAATGTADVLNLKLSSSGAITAGTVTAANVETINITADDTNSTAQTDTLTLVATKATTLNIDGDSGLNLTNTGNTALTAINASSMTGALTVTAAGTVATTITGGSGADALTASTGTVADVLIGGAGNDTLTANAGLTQLTGGTGEDLFVVATAGANVNIYSTITDAAAGDRIQLANKGAESFNTTKLTLGDTAVFQDYANLAAVGDGSTDGIISWFQFAGNTYIVMDMDATDSFVNATDISVKLVGLVDLSTASLHTATTPDNAILLLA